MHKIKSEQDYQDRSQIGFDSRQYNSKGKSSKCKKCLCWTFILLVIIIIGAASVFLYAKFVMQIDNLKPKETKNNNQNTIVKHDKDNKNNQDQSFYKSSLAQCQQKLTDFKVRPLDNQYVLYETRYKQVFLVLPKTEPFKNGTSCYQVIQWARNNIQPGDQITYQLQDPLLLVMITKFVGQNGKVYVYASQKNQKLFKKNLVTNDVDLVVQMKSQKQYITDYGDIIFGGDIKMFSAQMKKKQFNDQQLILKFNQNNQEEKIFLNQFVQRKSTIKRIVPANDSFCNIPRLENHGSNAILSNFYFIQTSQNSSIDAFSQQGNINKTSVTVASNSQIKCQNFKKFDYISGDGIYQQWKTIYQGVNLKIKKGTSQDQLKMQSHLIQYAQKHLKKGNKITYQGNNPLLPIILAKNVGDSGKVTVYISQQNQELFKKNFELNKVDKIIQIKQQIFEKTTYVPQIVISNNINFIQQLMAQPSYSKTKFIFIYDGNNVARNNMQMIYLVKEFKEIQAGGQPCYDPKIVLMEQAPTKNGIYVIENERKQPPKDIKNEESSDAETKTSQESKKSQSNPSTQTQKSKTENKNQNKEQKQKQSKNKQLSDEQKLAIAKYTNKSSYISQDITCQFKEKYEVRQIDQQNIFQQSIYKDIQIYLKKQDTKNKVTKQRQIISWAKQNIKPGYSIAYIGYDPLQIIALGKIVGQNGKISAYVKKQEIKLLIKNAQLNTVRPVINAFTIQQKLQYPFNLIIFDEIDMMNSVINDSRFKNTNFIIKKNPGSQIKVQNNLKSLNVNGIIFEIKFKVLLGSQNKCLNSVQVNQIQTSTYDYNANSYFVQTNLDDLAQPINGKNNNTNNKSIIQQTPKNTSNTSSTSNPNQNPKPQEKQKIPQIFQLTPQQKAILQKYTNRNTYDSSKLICYPKNSYQIEAINENQSLFETTYTGIFIINRNIQKAQIDSYHSTDQFIQWAKNSIQQGSIISYYGTNLLKIVALAKIVGEKGKINVYQDPIKHGFTQRNAVFNGVATVLNIQIPTLNVDINSNYIFLNDKNTLESFLKNPTLKNTKIVFFSNEEQVQNMISLKCVSEIQKNINNSTCGNINIKLISLPTVFKKGYYYLYDAATNCTTAVSRKDQSSIPVITTPPTTNSTQIANPPKQQSQIKSFQQSSKLTQQQRSILQQYINKDIYNSQQNPICQFKTKYQSKQINQNQSLYETNYHFIFIINNKNQSKQISSYTTLNGNQFISWGLINIPAGSIVSYYGYNLLEIIALAKIVKENGKINVYTDSSRHQLILRNGVLNDVVTVISLFQTKEKMDIQSQFIFTNDFKKHGEILRSLQYEKSKLIFFNQKSQQKQKQQQIISLNCIAQLQKIQCNHNSTLSINPIKLPNILKQNYYYYFDKRLICQMKQDQKLLDEKSSVQNDQNRKKENEGEQNLNNQNQKIQKNAIIQNKNNTHQKRQEKSSTKKDSQSQETPYQTPTKQEKSNNKSKQSTNSKDDQNIPQSYSIFSDQEKSLISTLKKSSNQKQQQKNKQIDSLICISNKSDYKTYEINPKQKLYQTLYEGIYLLEDQQQQIHKLEFTSINQFTQWIKYHIPETSHVIYDGYNQLEIVVLAKVVSQGSLTVYQNSQYHQRTRKNAVLNGVQKLISLKEANDTISGKASIMITNSVDRVGLVFQNPSYKNTKIVLINRIQNQKAQDMGEEMVKISEVLKFGMFLQVMRYNVCIEIVQQLIQNKCQKPLTKIINSVDVKEDQNIGDIKVFILDKQLKCELKPKPEQIETPQFSQNQNQNQNKDTKQKAQSQQDKQQKQQKQQKKTKDNIKTVQQQESNDNKKDNKQSENKSQSQNQKETSQISSKLQPVQVIPKSNPESNNKDQQQISGQNDSKDQNHELVLGGANDPDNPNYVQKSNQNKDQKKDNKIQAKKDIFQSSNNIQVNTDIPQAPMNKNDQLPGQNIEKMFENVNGDEKIENNEEQTNNQDQNKQTYISPKKLRQQQQQKQLQAKSNENDKQQTGDNQLSSKKESQNPKQEAPSNNPIIKKDPQIQNTNP